MYIYDGHKGIEYIIEEKVDSKWYLFKAAGYNIEAAQRALAKCQAEYPEKQFRIEETRYEDNWWNVWSD